MFVEKDIIKALIKKDRKATELFYKQYYPYIYKICYIYLRNEDDSRDAVSTAFMKIFEKLFQFDNENGHLLAWMRKIAVNVCIDSIRRKNKLPMDNTEIEQINFFVQQENITTKLHLKSIIKFIESMGTPMKEIVKLFAIEGHTHQEIADLLNISEQYSRVLLSQARKLLQMEFKEVNT